MPTYGYECKSCGHTFDAFQNMSDEPIRVCPECGKEVRRLINGGTGIIFKGSGFYVTDKGKGSSAGASSKSPAKPSSAESSVGASASSSTDKSADKPAASSGGEPRPSASAGSSGPAGGAADSKPKKAVSS
jgi:putative FmdB family regulatory protein